MADNSYRIRAKVGEDENVIRVNLKQGIKTLNILSLEIDPEDTYDVQTADYGVIIGRVLANDAFGVPNVKVSVFIPIEDEDKNDVIISNEYPYITPQSSNINGVKYNLIPTRKNSPGTFPNKRMILDNNGSIEVFDKYWKYTTTTNESGDYMLFGVPTGTCQVHYDCDLSDVGMISQHPYDFVAKGYDKNLFKSMTEFTETNLASAVHIMSQDKSVYVYPFWGDKDRNKIGITRYDIKIDYKFEPSCVFMGSSITDPEGSYIDVDGCPNGGNGRFNSLITTNGDIEIIRKRQDGSVEELKDNVKGIIDGNGVWCYQIPMNLDRIGTDEYGNMVAISDPNKGIPTRARVRFRISLNANNNESGGVTAKMLVPCNPKLERTTYISEETDMNYAYHCYESLPEGSHYNASTGEFAISSDYENMYEFGSNTPDSCFRDLYWGKVYSIKQYYPRFHYDTEWKHIQIYNNDIDGYNDANYFPRYDDPSEKRNMYDYTSYPPSYSFKQSCISSIDVVNGLNTFPYTTLYGGAEVGIDEYVLWWFYYHMTNTYGDESLLSKGLHFCFENDWVNGCLYFPRIIIKEKIGGGLDYFGYKNDSSNVGEWDKYYSNVYISGRHDWYCDKDGETDGIKDNNSFNLKNTNLRAYSNQFSVVSDYKEIDNGDYNVHETGIDVANINLISRFSRLILGCGIITKRKTILDDNVFYYRPGSILVMEKEYYPIQNNSPAYRRLYSTDIILLGNLNDIYDHMPKLYNSLPVTTATFPPVAPPKHLKESGMSKQGYQEQLADIEKNNDDDLLDIFGNKPDNLSFGDETWQNDGHKGYNGTDEASSLYKCTRYGIDKASKDALKILRNGGYKSGLEDYKEKSLLINLARRYAVFFNQRYDDVDSQMFYDIPSFVNLSRICELDVHNDSSFNLYGTIIPVNGMIDCYDISKNENRSVFAALNRDINRKKRNPLGYDVYTPTPFTINGFDGRLKGYIANNYFVYSENSLTYNLANDDKDKSYTYFRFGLYSKDDVPLGETFWRNKTNIDSNKIDNYANGPIYLTENSFYFYFGLRAGYSALDVLREKYIGEDESKKETIGAITVVQNDGDISCNSDSQIIGSCKIEAHGIPYPISFKIYNGIDLISDGYLNQTGTTVSNLLVAPYILKCTDATGREYENIFSIMGYGPNVLMTKDYDRATEMPTLTLKEINGHEISRVDDINNNPNVDDIMTPGNSFYVYYQPDDTSALPVKLKVEFNRNFDHVIVYKNYNAIPTIYFQEGTNAVIMSVVAIESGDQDLSCLSSTYNITLRNGYDLILTLNDVPVRYISGWSEYYDWETTVDEPDSALDSGNVEYNLWDSLMTLYPSGSTRTFKFEDSELTYDEQLSYISNMYQAICGDKDMSLVNTGDMDDTLLVTLSPNIDGYEDRYLNPTQTWNQPLTGDTTQKATINGIVYRHKDVPYIVGSNYPREMWFSGKTFFKKGGTSSDYVNNYTILETGTGGGNDLFGVNFFGCRDTKNGLFDEPASDIIPEISSNTLTKVDIKNGISLSNLFGLRTIDNRFDYQFAIRTPLTLPSGYEKFAGLQRSGLIFGSAWIDLYGGLRLNYNTSMRISCYRLEDGVITGGPQRNATGAGLNDKAKLYNSYIIEDGMGDMVPTTDESAITICYEDENGSECIDIDHVQYDVTNTGQGYQYFDAHFIDCSSDFANGIVKSGNHETIQISYKSGVFVEELIGSKYDVKYEVTFDTEEMMSDTETQLVGASFAGSSLNIKLSTDDIWQGITYTDISTSGTTDDIYPTWAQHEAGDIQPSDRNAELSVYQCQINSTSGELDIIEEYHLNMVVSADTLPSIPQYDKDYYVSAYYEEDGVKTPINDSMAENNIQFHLDDNDIAPTATTMSAHSFLVIPTKKIYTTPSAPTLLKQGVSFNAGYAYYTGQITITLDTMNQSFTMKLHTPLRGTNDIVDREVDDLIYDVANAYDIHTIGNISEYACDMGVITYNSNKEQFYVTLNSGYTTYNVFFRMENGLRYKVVVNILGDV